MAAWQCAAHYKLKKFEFLASHFFNVFLILVQYLVTEHSGYTLMVAWMSSYLKEDTCAGGP